MHEKHNPPEPSDSGNRDALTLHLLRTPEDRVEATLRTIMAGMVKWDAISYVHDRPIELPDGRWFKPEFIVCHRGQVGVIEVDGPHHARRYAADRSKDLLLEQAGVAFVERILVEDTQDPAELRDRIWNRVVLRLGRRAA